MEEHDAPFMIKDINVNVQEIMAMIDILFFALSDHSKCKRNIIGIGNLDIICDEMLEVLKMIDSTDDGEELVNAEFLKVTKIVDEQLLPQILDCPQGYVCRMNRTRKWLHYPSCPEDFVPSMKSLITAVHHRKRLATMMLDVISDSDSDVQFGSSAIDIRIPSCFSPSVSTTNKRKKQPTNNSSNKKTKTDQA
ncbi:hypothetical protein BDA99DRAFT_533535 [Phascolomyces articulosus]|uniref:Uncharacterized protein n=1 Tax=Phascolomyces articulosus TaxID=60185 RepID=A0AAD5KJ31_9FUNG|nr:hypothetical protein BDA99DRAFT_533535 [Phascolomyces articulosus]